MRDIWDLRTWVQTTEPYWTQAGHDHYPTKRPLCPTCQVRGVLARKDACEDCKGAPRRGRPAIQRTFLFDAAAQVEEEQEQAVVAAAGATATMSEAALIKPPFLPMLDVYEESPCEETPATMFSCQDDASACGDNDVVWWMESVDEQEGAFSGPEAEIRSRQETLPSRDDSETPATMPWCQDNASGCGGNDIVWWLESVDVQEDACFGADAEPALPTADFTYAYDGDLLLQSRDNEEQEITL